MILKKFIITIDTEGDNLWNWKEGEKITTENVHYLWRFQDLCNYYGFKPVYLSNWEMLQNEDFILFLKNTLQERNCELGMHLHAWNTPPFVPLPKNENGGAPYLIEYTPEIMEEKIKSITQLIDEKFGFIPFSHRAGRWAMNNVYFELLKKYGYRIDCSFTPGINWQSSKGMTPGFGGSDYRNVNKYPNIIQGILEVPMTIIHTRTPFFYVNGTICDTTKAFYHMLKGKNLWMRPNGHNLKEMLWIVDMISRSGMDYLMLMLHSSELMPGGSPTFQDGRSIENLYTHLEIVFKKIREAYIGVTLREYYETCFTDKALMDDFS